MQVLTTTWKPSSVGSNGVEEAAVKPGRIIAGGACGEHDCPTITLAGEGMVNVQGYQQTGIETATDEAVVQIPANLILEAARALGG